MLLALLVIFSPQSHAAKYATGLRIPSDWRSGGRFSEILGVEFPSKFDWKDKAKLPAIENQGQCGACWAFATTEVEEELIAIADRKVETLSPQELISCDTASYGCAGGFFSAFDYEKQKGLTYEKNFPYHAANTSCNVTGLPHDYRIFEWGYVGNPKQSPSDDQIKAQIFAGGPVAATICADHRFMNYHSGVYSGKASCQNHMIVLEGWDDSTQSWALRNSWGTSWGEKGFMRIKYGSNSVAQIAAFAVYKH